MELTFHQSLHQPDTPACGRRTSPWHIRMLPFSSNKILHWNYAFLSYWLLLFNSSFNQHIQYSLSHLILELLQLCFELSVLRLKVSVLPIEVL